MISYRLLRRVWCVHPIGLSPVDLLLWHTIHDLQNSYIIHSDNNRNNVNNRSRDDVMTWRRFHISQALCEGNPPPTGRPPFPIHDKGRLMRNFGVFYIVRLKKLLNKQHTTQRFKAPKCPCDTLYCLRYVALTSVILLWETKPANYKEATGLLPLLFQNFVV